MSYILFFRYPIVSVEALWFRAVVCLVRPSVRPSVRSFVRTDLVTTISHERLEHCRWNLQSLAPTDDLIKLRRSKVKCKGYNRLSRSRWHPRRRWSVEVHFGVISKIVDILMSCDTKTNKPLQATALEWSPLSLVWDWSQKWSTTV